MQKLTTAFILLASPFLFKAQNLVPNGDFEEYSKLPQQYVQVHFAKGWNNTASEQAKSRGTDYYHEEGKCPTTHFNPIKPISGKAQMGLCTYHSSMKDYREYLFTKLSSPLVKGKRYIISFYLSNGNGNKYPFKTANFGVHFSKQMLKQKDSETLEVKPQCEITSLITIDNSWQKFSFIYVAEADMEYIALGNFRTDDKTIRAGEGGSGGAYYFVDKIEVTPEVEKKPVMLTRNPEGAMQPLNFTLPGIEKEIRK